MRIIKINEQQYHSLLMNEEMHYPKFLDKLKDFVSAHVHVKIEEELKNKNYSFQFLLSCDCDYTDNIWFDINIDPNGDITDKRLYNCFYYNGYNSLFNGKLKNPRIIINCPCKNDNVIFLSLKTALSHELTHLYDDWNELSRNKDGINFVQKNQDTTKLVNTYITQKTEDLMKSISFLSYTSLKVERQAFLSQTIQELEEIGCTLSNYKQKIKETIIYNNLNKSYKTILSEINSTNDEDLMNFNKYVIDIVPKANIPKLNIGEFNAEKYRSMLLQWAEKTHHNMMKYYGSVVQYYLDKLQEEKNNMTSMYIL